MIAKLIIVLFWLYVNDKMVRMEEVLPQVMIALPPIGRDRKCMVN